jgi:ABC-type polysaccharide/polyol phosphate export permease
MRSRSVRQRFDLVRSLVQREFVTSYRRSALGWAWSLLLPLAQLAVLVVVFQYLVPLGIAEYPAFVFGALLPWTWFSTSVTQGCGMFLASADLVRRPGFEPAVLIVVSALAGFLSYVLALPILLGMLWLHGRPPGPSLAWFPLLAAIEGVLIVGVGLAVGTLNVFYRDVQYVVGVAVLLLFYLTPVFYEIPATLGAWRSVYLLNPMAALIEGYRAIFLAGTNPEAFSILTAAAVSGLVAVGGYLAYRRAIPDVVDLV